MYDSPQVRTVAQPSRLATVVHSVSDFQFLGFSAAERFSLRFPSLISHAPPEFFVTEQRVQSMQRLKAKKGKGTDTNLSALVDHSAGTHESDTKTETETIGAVVCDGYGNVACVTSTGE